MRALLDGLKKVSSSPLVDKPCVHCGLATPSYEETPENEVFCCRGCQGVYELIHGWGLQSYYDLRDRCVGELKMPTQTQSFEDFDTADFFDQANVQRNEDGSLSCRLAIIGLHCAACAWLIENVAARTKGWSWAQVKLSNHTLDIRFDDEKIRLSEIAQVLHQLGYELAPMGVDMDAGFQRQNRKLLIQIAIAGFCATNSMWLAIALYAGEASGIEAAHQSLLRGFGVALGVVAVTVPGRTFLLGALAALRNKTPHMDLPIAMGLLVGTIAGVVSLILGQGDVYFDSLAVLVFLLLIGRWIQFRQQHRAAKAIDLLLRMTPRYASLIEADEIVIRVLTDRLIVGDTIRVLPGQSSPADGEVVRGNSLIDRALLTGESEPVRLKIGDSIEAGVVNIESQLDIRVSAIGRESRIGQVLQAVEAASADRTPLVQLADRIGGVFVCIVTVLGCVAFCIWLPNGWQVAVGVATSLLIVACPCALALATPLAIAVSLGKSAKRRIFVRDGDSLTKLAKRGIVYFDKTGTLTAGRPSADFRFGDRVSLKLAAALESQVRHPIASAIIRLAQEEGISIDAYQVTVENVIGGVSGWVDDHQVLIGNADLLKQEEVNLPKVFAEAARYAISGGCTPIYVVVNGKVQSLLGISDRLKSDAIQTVKQLKNMGWEVGILSGDHPSIVTQIAKLIGAPQRNCVGNLTPEQKLDQIRCYKSGTVVMVGDGVNDAAALAAADVGIAVQGGAEVSLRAAPVFIAGDRLSSITALFCAARSSMTLIYTTFAVSLMYNLLAVGLALFGMITPLVAAILMPISSITVVSLALLWPIYRKDSI